MNQHVCIRDYNYVAGTSEKPEIGVFTQTSAFRKPSPWGKVHAGDLVWVKWSGGPIVAKAIVSGYRQMADTTMELFRAGIFGFKLYDQASYWNSRPKMFNGLIIFLTNEQWLDDPIFSKSRSRGSSWIYLDTSEKRKLWTKDSRDQRLKPRTQDPRGPRSPGKKLRFMVLRRDGFTCQYCGRRAPEFQIHVDHIVPWAEGGSTTLDNLCTSCRACNLGKGVLTV
jgi:5-methylcytosine-specific restriction endonuclease McrA